ncbi:hypothetical protein BDV25DRAFT_146524 [Aspergillus avenaceus]|uniref:DUF7703 domain-containing protein n=1 Tax=Aspergillus avenaceus TaxID=36643 RepID=A0A5N6U9T3_ASPAV|nr:hypothetical protein BDV25DRAFT_146524 [Aspergillus avenaceus]
MSDRNPIHTSDGDFGPDFVIGCVVAASIAIAWYNAIELIALCLATFKRYGGCYFWSLIIATVSIIPFALGYLLLIFDVFQNYFAVALEVIGWCGMVTGQSMVLWSRLHLVVHNEKILRGTLAMIIIDAILFHVPASVLEFGTHSNHTDKFTRAFDIFERIQLVGFSVQEIILSVIYGWAAIEMIRLLPRGRHKGILIQLIIVSLIMIGMDAAVVAIQYAGYFRVHVSVKAMAYSIKLKMEYAILGRLVQVSSVPSVSGLTTTDLSTFVDLSQPHDEPSLPVPSFPDPIPQTKCAQNDDEWTSPVPSCNPVLSKIS